MQSYISNHVDLTGWLEWDRDFVLKTLYYGLYTNGGPGAGMCRWVKWPGYHVMADANLAKKFSV